MAYYHSERVSTRLHEVNVPGLVVTTRWDPMVPRATTETALVGTPLDTTCFNAGSFELGANDTSVVDAGVFSGRLFNRAESWKKARVFPKLVHWELPSGGHVAWPEPPPPQRSVIEHVLDWLWAPTGLA
jgi:predicted alpha/beta-fold hydrolase